MVKRYASTDMALLLASLAVETGTMSQAEYDNKKTLLTASRYRRSTKPVSYISSMDRKKGVFR